MHKAEERCIQNFGLIRNYMADIGIDGSITLKLALRIWTEFICLMTLTSGGL
jgi:hypothetical protein